MSVPVGVTYLPTVSTRPDPSDSSYTLCMRGGGEGGGVGGGAVRAVLDLPTSGVCWWVGWVGAAHVR
jgi:hypothetical protein